jgi:hypothetical protein
MSKELKSCGNSWEEWDENGCKWGERSCDTCPQCLDYSGEYYHAIENYD